MDRRFLPVIGTPTQDYDDNDADVDDLETPIVENRPIVKEENGNNQSENILENGQKSDTTPAKITDKTPTSKKVMTKKKPLVDSTKNNNAITPAVEKKEKKRVS